MVLVEVSLKRALRVEETSLVRSLGTGYWMEEAKSTI